MRTWAKTLRRQSAVVHLCWTLAPNGLRAKGLLPGVAAGEVGRAGITLDGTARRGRGYVLGLSRNGVEPR